MLSDHQLIQILTRSKDATAIYDTADLRISFVNDAMLAIWGKDDSIIGEVFEQALPETIDQPFTAILKQVWQTGQPYNAVDTAATLEIDNKLQTSYFDFEYRPLVDAEGKTYAILHTATDVTSRVNAWEQVEERQLREEQLIEELSASNNNMQEANENLSIVNHDLTLSNENINRLNARLQESETDFKRLVEQAPVPILVFRGEDLVIDIANHAMLDLLGRDASLIGKPLLEGMPETESAKAVELLFEVYRTGRSFDGSEAPVPITRNGETSTGYFNFSYRPLMDNGKIIGVMDVAIEVTEQVLARKKLEANEQRLQSILDTMAEGLVIVDVNCIPTYVNNMAQNIMGISQDQYRDRQYNDAKWQNLRVDGSPLPAEDHPMNVVLRTGLPVYDQEIAVILATGEKIFISINAAPTISDEGEVTGGIATFTDVTNRRLILQQKEDFISVASHELKTPVTALKASLQLLDKMQETIKPEMQARLLSQANRSLDKLSDLINSLLNSNRISQGRFPINKREFALSQLIDDCCQHVRTVGNHDILLKGALDLKINADEQLLDQVIVNLVNNAVKYAPSSKQIIIEVEHIEDKARISVTDFGPGIPESKLPYLFERYYQGQDGNGATFSGLGLGLYICAEIIHKHGGKIGVESQQGKGSTFWFTLPLI
ncbi:PAS domain S-box protein [Mucilaginibacter conchicola]|uniref:histidine kinase n=1 Tax=Mucilaginibacter conchicola TaxID=2303333 RepID=A0A372NXT9_9SPHI|nr:PAS domain-containing protein [Mucilaginibacter conchicola]RFZ94938.1 PAS domain S-box protein [Mucilaginibacter conchicola]